MMVNDGYRLEDIVDFINRVKEQIVRQLQLNPYANIDQAIDIEVKHERERIDDLIKRYLEGELEEDENFDNLDWLEAVRENLYKTKKIVKKQLKEEI